MYWGPNTAVCVTHCTVTQVPIQQFVSRIAQLFRSQYSSLCHALHSYSGPNTAVCVTHCTVTQVPIQQFVSRIAQLLRSQYSSLCHALHSYSGPNTAVCATHCTVIHVLVQANGCRPPFSCLLKHAHQRCWFSFRIQLCRPEIFRGFAPFPTGWSRRWAKNLKAFIF
jgi:hypothetical protein